MASSAFADYEYNVMDARRLLQAHALMVEGKPGKKGFGHITRSGVVMLCAAWESYQEAVIVEGVEYVAGELASPKNLPKAVKKYLSEHVKTDKNALRPMDLAGDGWRDLYVGLAKASTESLNTPKSARLIELYDRLLGIDDIAALWTVGGHAVDDFVSVRGEIAHNGRNAPYTKAGTLKNYIDMIDTAVREHDNKLCDLLKSTAAAAKQPWRKTA